MDKFDIVNGKKLRYGFTTGSCATAGAKAACEMLFNNRKVDFIKIKLINGELLNIEVENLLVKDEYVEAAIIKDAGDDPDITNGIEIRVQVRKIKETEINIIGGVGVGKVTKKGLNQAVGQWAINSGPRQMIKENLKTVQEHIKESIAKRHNAASEDVLLVAVTKNHDVASMQEAIDAGANVIGENRVQEALQKHETLNRDVTWHLIGHLQTNKAKYAVKLFDMIESVDSIKLAEALNKEAQKIDKVQQVLVQVNLVKEASKTGVYLEELDEILAKIDILSNLKLMGLMFIAPKVDNLEDVRPMFAQMFKLFKKVQAKTFATSEIKYLSMGMTHDYQIAIEEGANIVRVGTGIFGPRQY